MRGLPDKFLELLWGRRESHTTKSPARAGAWTISHPFVFANHSSARFVDDRLVGPGIRITVERWNAAEASLINRRVGQRQHALKHALRSIPGIMIPVDSAGLSMAHFPRWREAA